MLYSRKNLVSRLKREIKLFQSKKFKILQNDEHIYDLQRLYGQYAIWGYQKVFSSQLPGAVVVKRIPEITIFLSDKEAFCFSLKQEKLKSLYPEGTARCYLMRCLGFTEYYQDTLTNALVISNQLLKHIKLECVFYDSQYKVISIRSVIDVQNKKRNYVAHFDDDTIRFVSDSKEEVEKYIQSTAFKFLM